ncbi:MAG: hypothetical protein ABIG84_02075 [archaeon]
MINKQARVIAIFKLKKHKKAQMSLEMIIGLIILLVVAAVVIKIFMDKMSPQQLEGPETLELEAYRQHCDSLCSRYVDTNFAAAEGLAYCEKYFEIDLNKNGKIPGEAGKLNAFGVCEERVYCMNIKECNWGSSKNSRLTPQKCRDIMCDIYTERQGGVTTVGANASAAVYIENKIEFGTCDQYDSEISFEDTSTTPSTSVSLAAWHVSTFLPVADGGLGVHCRGLTG